jgi:hypothetical protein
MHELWSQSLRGGPGPTKELPSGVLNQRASAWYADKWRRRIKYVVVPIFFGATYVIIAAILVNQAAVKVAESFGWLCGQETRQSPALMAVDATCHATGFQVAAGRTYRVLLTVEQPWFDKSIPAGPEGLALENAGSWLVMKLAVPLRRHIAEDWFAVMAKIGRSGLDSRALALRRAEGAAGTGDETWEADFAADADGELLLYVNDALLLGWTGLYANNQGSAKIVIEPKPE